MQNTSLTKTRILNTLKREQRVLKRYRVKRLGLFGSYVKGNPGRRSDLDFVVEFEQPSFDNFMNLHAHLEQLFGRKVDLLTPEGVKSIRVKSIAQDIQRSMVYV